MNKTIIIGGGATGLILAYKLKQQKKNFVLLSDSPQAFAKRFAGQYIFLRYDLRIRQLLKELNIPYKKKVFKMGFYYNRKIYSKPALLHVQNYNQKIYNSDKISDFNLKNQYFVCDVNYMSIIEKLEEEVKENIIYDKVSAIDMGSRNKHYIYTLKKEIYQCSNLISTVPLPIFLKFIKMSDELYLNELPYLSLILRKSNFEMDGYQQVSNCELDNIIIRYVKTDQMVTQEEIKVNRIIDSSNIIAYLQYGKIFNKGKNIAELLTSLERDKRIFMAGRFSEWEPHFDTEDSVTRAQEICNKIGV